MAVAGSSENNIKEDPVYENFVTKTTTAHQEKDPQKIQRSVTSRYRLVAVGLGLLCAAQAVLITALGLTFYQCKMVVRDQRATSCESLANKNNLTDADIWQKFGRHRYYISTERKTWEESRQYCRDRRSDLMVINSKELQDLVDRLDQKVWLGLTDREEEGTFRWVDGTPLTTPTYWLPGQPNNNNGREDCVEFNNSPNARYRGWNDRSCSITNHWICWLRRKGKTVSH